VAGGRLGRLKAILGGWWAVGQTEGNPRWLVGGWLKHSTANHKVAGSSLAMPLEIFFHS